VTSEGSRTPSAVIADSLIVPTPRHSLGMPNQDDHPRTAGPAPKARALQRRGTVRIESELDVSLFSENNFFTGFTEDLSDGGIFIATYEPRAVGDRLLIRLTLPEVERPITAKVEVRWLRVYDPTSDSPPGFGAQFVEIGKDERAAIERFVKQREPLFHPI